MNKKIKNILITSFFVLGVSSIILYKNTKNNVQNDNITSKKNQSTKRNLINKNSKNKISSNSKKNVKPLASPNGLYLKNDNPTTKLLVQGNSKFLFWDAFSYNVNYTYYTNSDKEENITETVSSAENKELNGNQKDFYNNVSLNWLYLLSVKLNIGSNDEQVKLTVDDNKGMDANQYIMYLYNKAIEDGANGSEEFIIKSSGIATNPSISLYFSYVSSEDNTKQETEVGSYNVYNFYNEYWLQNSGWIIGLSAAIVVAIIVAAIAITCVSIFIKFKNRIPELEVPQDRVIQMNDFYFNNDESRQGNAVYSSDIFNPKPEPRNIKMTGDEMTSFIKKRTKASLNSSIPPGEKSRYNSRTLSVDRNARNGKRNVNIINHSTDAELDLYENFGITSRIATARSGRNSYKVFQKYIKFLRTNGKLNPELAKKIIENWDRKFELGGPKVLLEEYDYVVNNMAYIRSIAGLSANSESPDLLENISLLKSKLRSRWTATRNPRRTRTVRTFFSSTRTARGNNLAPSSARNWATDETAPLVATARSNWRRR